MSELRPSDFANLGQPCCSIWGKSEIEWLALAYVQALAAGGDTWRKLSREEVRDLLTDEQRQRGSVRLLLKHDHYKGWFDMVSNQIADADGALDVGGFWNKRRFETQPTSQPAARGES
jgi:hypothetical protein